jgi:hypothetical protein
LTFGDDLAARQVQQGPGVVLSQGFSVTVGLRRG